MSTIKFIFSIEVKLLKVQGPRKDLKHSNKCVNDKGKILFEWFYRDPFHQLIYNYDFNTNS